MDVFNHLSHPYPASSPDNFSKVIIYGAGNTGKDIQKFLKNFTDLEIVSFLDARVQNDYLIEGISVSHPERNEISDSIKRSSTHGTLTIISIFARMAIMDWNEFYTLIKSDLKIFYVLLKPKKV